MPFRRSIGPRGHKGPFGPFGFLQPQKWSTQIPVQTPVSLGGGFTPSGTVFKAVAAAPFDGAITPGPGDLTTIRIANVAVSGVIIPGPGTLSQRAGKLLTAGITPGPGVLVRRVGKLFSAGITPGPGTLSQRVGKPLIAGITPGPGVLTTTIKHVLAITGAITPGPGDLLRRINKLLTGGITPGPGVLLKRATRSASGGITPGPGVLTKRTNRPIVGTMGTTGFNDDFDTFGQVAVDDPDWQVFGRDAGTAWRGLYTAGDMAISVGDSFFYESLETKTRFNTIANGLIATFLPATYGVNSDTVPKFYVSDGTVEVGVYYSHGTGTLYTYIGVPGGLISTDNNTGLPPDTYIIINVSQDDGGTVALYTSSDGIDLIPLGSYIMSLVESGYELNFANIKVGAGLSIASLTDHIDIDSIAIVASAPSVRGVISKRAGKLVVGGITPGPGTIIRRPGKVLTGTELPTGALLKKVQRFLTGAMSVISGALTKRASTSFTANITPTGIMSVRPAKILTGAELPSGSLVRKILWVLTGSATPSGILTPGSVLHKSVQGTITPNSDLIASTGGNVVVVGGTIIPHGQVTKRSTFAVIASLIPSGALLWKVTKTFIGTVTSAGITFITRPKTVAGTMTQAGAVTRNIQAHLSGVEAPSATLLKRITRVITGVITPVGVMLKKVTKLTFTGTVTPTASLATRSIRAKVLQGTITPTGTLARQVRAFLSAVINPSGVVTKYLTHELVGLLATSGTLHSRVSRDLQAGMNPAGIVTRLVQYRRSLGGSITPVSFLVDYAIHVFPLYFSAAILSSVRLEAAILEALTLDAQLRSAVKLEADVVHVVDLGAKLE